MLSVKSCHWWLPDALSLVMEMIVVCWADLHPDHREHIYIEGWPKKELDIFFVSRQIFANLNIFLTLNTKKQDSYLV